MEEYLELDVNDYDAYSRSKKGKSELSKKIVRSSLPAATKRQMYKEIIERKEIKRYKKKKITE